MTLDDEVNNLLPELTKKTAEKLSFSKTELDSLSWHKGESNVDVEFSELAKEKCIEAFDELNKNKLLSLIVEIPDLLLCFKRGNNSLKEKIELKSTKSNDRSIPGSMIMSLDPNMWTIFCLRLEKGYEFRYGRYHLGMSKGTHDLFQDRSPRPRLKFDQYQKLSEEPNLKTESLDTSFYKHYAKSAINRVLKPTGRGSWQDDLVKEIIKAALKDPKKFKDI